MCGIVGALSFTDNFPITHEYIVRMRDVMRHRGPDGAGVWVSTNRRVGLGHRRLSIIDLSDLASQPMANEDGSVQIVFNGEIYNHAEIRSELLRLGGHRWRTDHSDTEVILHAFEQWGIECVQKFRGMFAIGLWDDRRRELWLIRDRIGVKPLYYSIHDGRIVFASEIKALLEDPQQRRAVNEEAFFHYLSFLTAPAPDTLFQGIKKLPAGSCLKIGSDGTIIERRYWDVLDHAGPIDNASEDDIIEMILAELRTSVKLRKVSDVPVGVFLSGGVDSSANAALFSETGGGPVKTFTIGYDGDYSSCHNETGYARMVAQQVGAEHHELLLSADDLISFLPQMVHLQDEPIADPVCVPVYYVSKLAREQGVVVCQVGEGADELFCGYRGWKQSIRLQQLNDLPMTSLLQRLGMYGLKIAGREESFPHEWLRRAAAGLPIFWGGAEAFDELQKQRLLSPRLRRQFSDRSSWEALAPIRDRFLERAWDRSPLAWMSYLDLNLRLPELLLMRVDKMSMGVSLEGRVPFLDHKLVELAMSLPQSLRLKNGEPKYLLKKAVRGLIPDAVINRPKQGFGVPLHEWFMQRLGRQARDVLSDFCDQTDFFDKHDVQRYIDDGKGAKVWYLLNFAYWWKHYIEGTPVETPRREPEVLARV
jgi:asparagine synthase (glutamine-hydrolysing)